MIRPLLRHGAPVLHRPADPVASITPEIQTVVDDLVQTMYAAPGIGLAAPQIGVPLRIFVVDITAGRSTGELIVMVNPEFVEREGMQVEDEGCLSVPGFNASVVRPARTVVRGLDRQGVERTVEATGLLARAFQHEIDHLDGTLFIDRLRGIKRDLIVRRIQKLKRCGKW
ncbi:MAG TPA: peptide deformylase [Vicinamibacterales bacterium]|jgi:peptide deformylase|nr:peptide deformylase [Vicinamibacterales bacterium]